MSQRPFFIPILVAQTTRLALVLAALGLACGSMGCGTDESNSKSRWSTEEPDTGEDSSSKDTDDGADVGEPDASEVEPGDVQLPSAPTRVETVITSANPVAAGGQVTVECQLFDADDQRVYPEAAPAQLVYTSPTTSFLRSANGQIQAIRAGVASLSCAIESLGLVDLEPARLTIVAGEAHTVTTVLDRHVISAGETTSAFCVVFDAYDNVVSDAEPTLISDVSGSGINIEGLDVTITRAGFYTLSCTVPGAAFLDGDLLEVNPTLPAHLVISRVPDQNVYAVGQVISIASLVTDRYDNTITNARVGVTSDPVGEEFGSARFRYHQEGTYVLTALVEGPTEGDVELRAQTTVIINSFGPAIQCDYPADGQMIHAAPGSSITLTGRASDTHGISKLTVNQDLVAIGAGGSFSTSHTVRYGINFVDIAAEDQFGAQNVRTCAFLASNTWTPEAGFFNDDVTLRLGQTAIDDVNRAGPVNSLADILHVVLSSAGLRNSLHQSLLAANPLKPMSCDATLIWCLHWSRVDYLNSTLTGPHSVGMTLVADGLRMVTTVRNFSMNVKITGTTNTTGWVHIEYVTVDLTSNLRLQSGKPQVSLRQINSVQVGAVNMDFPGFSGVIIDMLGFFFQNTLRDMVRDLVRDYIQSSFNQVLDGLVSGLDVNSLGGDLAVPRLDGEGVVNLNFGIRFSSLLVSSARALFGIGTEMTAAAAHAIPSRGVPYPAGTVLLDPTTNQNAAVAVHVGVLNQTLHALWRGGFFHARVGSALFGDSMPEGAYATLETRLPPVAVLSAGGKLTLMLGAVRVSLVYPGLFDEPVVVHLGATARSLVSLQGNELSFSGIQIDEFYFSPESIALNEQSRDVLDNFLRNLVQGLVDASLNNALPSLPIPSFVLPASMSVYGLPAGRELGLTNPNMSSSALHIILQGAFGLR
ncbi:MAG: hypothetical protein H0U74_22855 [Bradymonadaceae bacterium]|nr:hypothetical protein [Lujinxingiaceae bacterium]